MSFTLDPTVMKLVGRAFTAGGFDPIAGAGGKTLRADLFSNAFRAFFGPEVVRTPEQGSPLAELVAAQAAALRFVDLQVKAGGASSFSAPQSWLAPLKESSEIGTDRRMYGFIGTATVVSLAIALGQRAEKLSDQILQIGFGVDPVNSTIRNRLIGPWGGNRDPMTIGIELPPKLLPFLDVMQSTCLGTLRGAIGALGAAVSGMEAPVPASRIRSIKPTQGCPGVIVSLTGSGFGAVQPPNASVMFTAYAGGRTAGVITSWSDTEIVVEAPADVGEGPVTLSGLDDPNNGASFATAIDTLNGAATACLGSGAARVAGAIGRPYFQPSHSLSISFAGGKPRIKHLRGNGTIARALVRPNGMLHVEWDVGNADTVMLRTGVTSHFLPLMNQQVAARGSFDFGPLVGTQPWQETIELEASNGCGTVVEQLTVDMSDRRALVLSGGGSKAAFEVGAVRCLYDVFNYIPTIITSSSAGSLNAAKLAEGPASLPALEQMWLNLSGPPDMFQPTPRVLNILRQWRIIGLLPQQLFELSDMLGVQVNEYNWVTPEMEIAIGVAKDTFSQAVSTNGLLFITDIIARGLKLGLAIGKLVDEIKKLLDADSSLFLFDPIRRLLDANVDPAIVARSGISVRVSVLDMNSGRTRYVDENGHFTDDTDTMAFLDAVQASASIPVAFPPVIAGNGTYLDGGTRDNLPLAAADMCGAGQIVAVVPSPLGVSPHDYRAETILPLGGRTIEVIMDEGQLNDYKPYRGFNCPVRMIAPSFEVHNLFKVDPGLIQISMDYGHMRAFDVMQPDDRIRTQLFALSDQIAQNRLSVWGELEHHSEGELKAEEKWGFVSNQLRRTPSADAQADVRIAKLQLRDLYRRRIALATEPRCVPQGSERVWQTWERHSWTPLTNSPWDDSGTRVGPFLNAVAPPPPL